MHGHGNPKLAKKLNDKIPKTVDDMFERVRALVRGEVTAGSAEMVRPSQRDKGYVCLAWTREPERARNKGSPREARRNMGVYTPYPRKDTFTPLTNTLKEILAMESVSFPEPPPLIKTPEKQNLNKFCDYHEDRGHNTNDCYQLKKQIEEVVASGKLAYLVKDIRQNNQRNGNPGNDVKVINMIRQEGNRKRLFKERRSGKPECQHLVKTQKMQDSDDRFFRGNVSSFKSNRSSSNFGKGRKKQDGSNGVCNNKMSFSIQHHNRKDRNEKPRSNGFYHPLYD
uniref:Reverse transcriptase domain-containing protein n=1 Tax=Tanacetum cinerariifolium TaxID=118510 RepID=A0A699KVL4_TANCI|nr:reverse transcriptase domain-containing protein [Tanacetum cinerariifolium]